MGKNSGRVVVVDSTVVLMAQILVNLINRVIVYWNRIVFLALWDTWDISEQNALHFHYKNNY
jgi:hypothetical protein